MNRHSSSWHRARPGAPWVLGLPLVLGACGASAEAGDGSGGPAADEPTFQRVINVETQVLAPARFVETIRLTGTVLANRDVTVAAEESGVVRELMVDKGASVRAGEPLARIDDRVLRAQVEEARARARFAQETWDRRKRLYEEDEVGSELAYLEARYAAEQAAASLQALEERLARTVVMAPFAGVVEERMVEVGSMLSPGAPVVRLVDLNPVKVVAGVPERYAADVHRGAEAVATFDVLEGQVFEGRITFAAAAVDARSRTFSVEFSLPNPGHTMKPQMIANVGVTRRTLDDALVVPQEAVIRAEDGYVAFVVEDEDGQPRAKRRRVELGPSARNRVVVRAGLHAADRLIVVGQQQVAEGDRVRVVEER